MHVKTKPKVVVLGTMSKMPVAGIVFITVQYLIGLKRLGFDAYYVEAHARTPSMFMTEGDGGNASALAAAFIRDVMRRFDLGEDHWAFQALHDDGTCYGLSEEALARLYRDAALIFNLHGATVPRPEHYETGRLVYIGTDPVAHEVEVHQGVQDTIAYLEPHCAFFTWGENYGNSDCGVPPCDPFEFIPTRQPIVMDLWESFRDGPADAYTTIGNWRQLRPVTLKGEVYQWSKHDEFLKFIDLPLRSGQRFELALSSFDNEDHRVLTANGWQVRESLRFTTDLDAYRKYIGGSKGEFTVAKDQNVRLRSGWFSDRSASYLACGRPVITQETGFSNILPTGDGLFAFSTIEDIEDALVRIDRDYARHCAAASKIARECFDYRVVLSAMLDHLASKPAPAQGVAS